MSAAIPDPPSAAPDLDDLLLHEVGVAPADATVRDLLDAAAQAARRDLSRRGVHFDTEGPDITPVCLWPLKVIPSSTYVPD